MTGERVQRRLAAVLAADVAGYSRLMGADEVGTLAALKAHRRDVMDPAIAEHGGRIVKTTGDGVLVEFSSAVDAVTCAMLVQGKMAERKSKFLGPTITFRIGINVGDIIIDADDIFGDGVNVAARVENESRTGRRVPVRQRLRAGQRQDRLHLRRSRRKVAQEYRRGR